jgi:hypothetical protein
MSDQLLPTTRLREQKVTTWSRVVACRPGKAAGTGLVSVASSALKLSLTRWDSPAGVLEQPSRTALVRLT